MFALFGLALLFATAPALATSDGTACTDALCPNPSHDGDAVSYLQVPASQKMHGKKIDEQESEGQDVLLNDLEEAEDDQDEVVEKAATEESAKCKSDKDLRKCLKIPGDFDMPYTRNKHRPFVCFDKRRYRKINAAAANLGAVVQCKFECDPENSEKTAWDFCTDKCNINAMGFHGKSHCTYTSDIVLKFGGPRSWPFDNLGTITHSQVRRRKVQAELAFKFAQFKTHANFSHSRPKTAFAQFKAHANLGHSRTKTADIKANLLKLRDIVDISKRVNEDPLLLPYFRNHTNARLVYGVFTLVDDGFASSDTTCTSAGAGIGWGSTVAGNRVAFDIMAKGCNKTAMTIGPDSIFAYELRYPIWQDPTTRDKIINWEVDWATVPDNFRCKMC